MSGAFGAVFKTMSTKRVRWIFCGLLPLAFFGLSGCNGLSGGGRPTVTLSATPNTIIAGQSVSLAWQSTNATSVTITAAAGTSAPRTVATVPQVAGSVSDSPTQTTTYTAVAKGKGGDSQPQTVTVQVQPPAPPQITQFSAAPTTVGGGQTTTITWATTDATTVNITPAVTNPEDGPTPLSGSAVVPVQKTTTFSITASGPGGTAGPQTVTVTVPFTLILSASPSNIIAGQSATLSWQVTGGAATSITVTDPTGAAVCSPCALPQGTATVTPSATTTYTATAAVNATTNVTATASVTVGSAASGVIKHIFYMLQENRGFDMYFGQLGAYRTGRLAQFGIADTQTIDGFDPNVTLTNHNTGAKVKPFHEATVCTDNLTPSWDESHHDVSLTGGDSAWQTTTAYTSSSFAMDNFLDTTGSVPQQSDPNGTRAMGYYNQQDLPYYYDLASFFPTSDAWHSPLLASTVPNRMYLMAATSFGHEYSDSSGHPAYAAPTIFRSMNAANVSWIYYYVDGVFLANFTDFQNDPTIRTKTFPMSDLMNRLAGNCSGGPCDPDKALPQVIFLESGSGGSELDEHPGNNIQTGAAFVQSIIQALMNSDAWQDSVFILTYDEGGGTYDHVPPISVPLPDQYAPGQCPDANTGSTRYCSVGTIGGTFDLSGFRVPMIVLSPYAKPNFVSHTPRDYTAILAFIEKTFGVPPLTARDGYWLQNGDMQEFFDFTNPALLKGPGGAAWPSILSPQPTNGLCDITKEAGPTQ